MALLPGQSMAGEAEAIAECKRLGAIYGYGNLIGHLQEAWRDLLVDKGLDPITAAYHVGMIDLERAQKLRAEMDDCPRAAGPGALVG